MAKKEQVMILNLNQQYQDVLKTTYIENYQEQVSIPYGIAQKIREYQMDSQVKQRLIDLRHNYPVYRELQGDNAFYRAFAFAYFELLLQGQDLKELIEVMTYVQNTKDVLKVCKLKDKDKNGIYKDLHQNYDNIHIIFIAGLQKIVSLANLVNRADTSQKLLTMINISPAFDISLQLFMRRKALEGLENFKEKLPQQFLKGNEKKLIESFSEESNIEIISRILAEELNTQVIINSIGIDHSTQDIDISPQFSKQSYQLKQITLFWLPSGYQQEGGKKNNSHKFDVCYQKTVAEQFYEQSFNQLKQDSHLIPLDQQDEPEPSMVELLNLKESNCQSTQNTKKKGSKITKGGSKSGTTNNNDKQLNVEDYPSKPSGQGFFQNFLSPKKFGGYGINSSTGKGKLFNVGKIALAGILFFFAIIIYYRYKTNQSLFEFSWLQFGSSTTKGESKKVDPYYNEKVSIKVIHELETSPMNRTRMLIDEMIKLQKEQDDEYLKLFNNNIENITRFTQRTGNMENLLQQLLTTLQKEQQQEQQKFNQFKLQIDTFLIGFQKNISDQIKRALDGKQANKQQSQDQNKNPFSDQFNVLSSELKNSQQQLLKNLTDKVSHLQKTIDFLQQQLGNDKQGYKQQTSNKETIQINSSPRKTPNPENEDDGEAEADEDQKPQTNQAKTQKQQSPTQKQQAQSQDNQPNPQAQRKIPANQNQGKNKANSQNSVTKNPPIVTQKLNQKKTQNNQYLGNSNNNNTAGEGGLGSSQIPNVDLKNQKIPDYMFDQFKKKQTTNSIKGQQKEQNQSPQEPKTQPNKPKRPNTYQKPRFVKGPEELLLDPDSPKVLATGRNPNRAKSPVVNDEDIEITDYAQVSQVGNTGIDASLKTELRLLRNEIMIANDERDRTDSEDDEYLLGDDLLSESDVESDSEDDDEDD